LQVVSNRHQILTSSPPPLSLVEKRCTVLPEERHQLRGIASHLKGMIAR
ncbi:hypothetical protein LEMLEM_LOCUS5746, partial [Lemmus lemmus]